MTKKRQYELEIRPLLEANKYQELEAYIIKNANLPGRMANITLVSTIADIFEKNSYLRDNWYQQLTKWFELENDGNSPETVLSLVALESFGSFYLDNNFKKQEEILNFLQESLNDERWRMREIVTESYKRIGLSSYDSLIKIFDAILLVNLTPLEMRGILATLAHPDLLVTEKQKEYAQSILEVSFDYYLKMDRNTVSKEDEAVLIKGLSFAPSVIVSEYPDAGFSYFEKLIKLNNKKINRIIKENVKKKRLSSIHSSKTEEMLDKLNKK